MASSAGGSEVGLYHEGHLPLEVDCTRRIIFLRRMVHSTMRERGWLIHKRSRLHSIVMEINVRTIDHYFLLHSRVALFSKYFGYSGETKPLNCTPLYKIIVSKIVQQVVEIIIVQIKACTNSCTKSCTNSCANS